MREDETPAERDAKRAQWHRMPGWKKGWLAVSMACMIAGAVLTMATRLRAEPKSAGTGTTAVQSVGGGQTDSSKTAAPSSARGIVDARSRNLESQQENAAARSEEVEVGSGAKSPEPSSVIARFSPALFKLGFSFFAGFCVAYALRAFLKLAVFLLGVAFLGAFALQYFGVLDINWHLIGGHYDSAAQWVSSQFATFERFVTGQLPSAASAAVGLVVGFKR